MFSFATKFSPEAANFEKAVFAGYESAELYLTTTRLMSWRSLSKIARSYDLNYVLHFPTSGKLSQQTSEEIVALARDIQCSLIVVHEENLNVACHIQKLDPSIRLAVENQSIGFDELDSWMDAQQHVSLNIDGLWKTTLQNCDRNEMLSVVTRLVHSYRDRIANIHLSGYTPGQKGKPPLSQSPEHALDLFDLFYRNRYQGLVVAELDREHQDPDQLKTDAELFLKWQVEKGISPLVDSHQYLGIQSPLTEPL